MKALAPKYFASDQSKDETLRCLSHAGQLALMKVRALPENRLNGRKGVILQEEINLYNAESQKAAETQTSNSIVTFKLQIISSVQLLIFCWTSNVADYVGEFELAQVFHDIEGSLLQDAPLQSGMLPYKHVLYAPTSGSS